MKLTNEENMTDAVANAVCEALSAQSLKRGETMNIIAEAMVTVDNILKAKGVGHQKMARGLVRGLNPSRCLRR